MKDNVMIALLVLVLFAVLFQPQIQDAFSATGQYTTVAEKTGTLLDGDYNRDGEIDIQDYYQFKEHLARYNPAYMKQVDLNYNNLMDSEDLEMLWDLVQGNNKYEDRDECQLDQCRDGDLLPCELGTDGYYKFGEPEECPYAPCRVGTGGEGYCPKFGEGQGFYRE